MFARTWDVHSLRELGRKIKSFSFSSYVLVSEANGRPYVPRLKI